MDNIPKQLTVPSMPKSHVDQVKEHCQALVDLFGADIGSLYADDNMRSEQLNYYLLLCNCKVHADGREDILINSQGFSFWGEKKQVMEKPKYWIKITNSNYSPFDGSPEYKYYCPACDKENISGKTNFCPHCGLPLEEVVE